MPNHKATEKSLRQNSKRQASNVAIKSRLRTLVKKVRVSAAEKNTEMIKDQLKDAISALDTAAKKHIIHPKNAARKKSRLTKLVNKTESAQ